MKPTLLLLALYAASSLAYAETRSIAVQITRSQDSAVLVSIHSGEKSENKRGVSVAEAKKILANAQGWGSSVLVVIVPAPGIQLAEYLPLLETIAQNPWLDLAAVRAHDHADAILRHFKLIESQPNPSK